MVQILGSCLAMVHTLRLVPILPFTTRRPEKQRELSSRQELRRVILDSPTGSVSSSSGTSTPSAPDAVEKLVATLNEANAIELQHFESEKQLSDIKLAESARD